MHLWGCSLPVLFSTMLAINATLLKTKKIFSTNWWKYNFSLNSMFDSMCTFPFYFICTLNFWFYLISVHWGLVSKKERTIKLLQFLRSFQFLSQKTYLLSIIAIRYPYPFLILKNKCPKIVNSVFKIFK